MKRNVLMVMVLMLMCFGHVRAADPVELSDLTRPSMFIVNFDRIYVLEQATVRIYSLKDFSLIKKFGRAGEGPKEFKYSADGGRPLSMSFFKGQLIVNSEMKMSFFDKDGIFKREQKVSVDRLLFPINGKYLGIGPTAREAKSICIGFSIFDSQFKSPQVIFISDVEMNNPNRFVLPMTSFTYNPVYKGRIYVNSSSDEFRIHVYNIEGKKEYSIEKQYPRIKIPDRFLNDAMAFFKVHPNFKNAIDYLKRILVIRDYFPPIRDLQIVEDHIYVLTFKRKGSLWELIKLDLKGNEKGRVFIPLSDYEYFTWYPVFYSVYKEKIYSLVEDVEDEVWKVHVSAFQ
jgi:hypothetical protein